jgi:hypothetical protein
MKNSTKTPSGSARVSGVPSPPITVDASPGRRQSSSDNTPATEPSTIVVRLGRKVVCPVRRLDA